MAILSREPDVFPDGLLLEGAHQSTVEKWWVLHTRPRAEKSLARQLRQRGISYYLPTYERRRRLQGRSVVSYLPLFPSYLFLRGSEDDRYAAFRTNLVVQSLDVRDQERLLADMASVYRLVETGLPLSPEDRLLPGQKVEVTDGPLLGFRGTVVQRGSASRLLVEVQMLNRGVSVELDPVMVQPV